MLDEGLSGTAVSGGWHLMIVAALAVGAFVVAAFLIWDRTRIWERTRKIDTRLRRAEKIIYLFEMQESRRFVIELNAKSSVKADQHGTAKKMSADVVTEPTISPATGAERLENGKSVKLANSRRPLPCRKPVSQR